MSSSPADTPSLPTPATPNTAVTASPTPAPPAVAAPATPEAALVAEPQPTQTDTSGPKEIDIVFCVDCTGSMGSYISAAQQNVVKICEELVVSEKADLRFALVCYRDHPPQDSTYVTKVFDFTSSHSKMQTYVGTMQAAGGGDGPEAVTAALHDALYLPYRKNATKFCILIADAPPHGIGENGDGFPNGDPDGKDPIEIAHGMLEKGITLYVASCEPSVSNSYTYATDFFLGIAKITEGKCLPLTSAALLAQVIVGGAAEEASLEALVAQAEKEAKRVAEERRQRNLSVLSDEAMATEVATRFQAQGFTAKKCSVDDVGYASRATHNVDAMYSAKNMEEARTKWTPIKSTVSAPAPDFASSMSRSPRGVAAPMPQSCHRSEGIIETEQVHRLMTKMKARK